ncbi:MAG TPA: ADOP family duplicated permease [Vicinamibacterales bacterium]|nr:ADOP family duplicated permease [Vicinamibacterales bacterium]
MRIWHILASRFRSVFFRGRRESDLHEELQLHIGREIERLVAAGIPADEARRQTLRAFGGVEQIKEASRDARGTAALDALARDTRHGLRRLVRDWRFTTAAVLILGLAIGANTAVFSVVNAVLFRDQGFADPDRLVDIYQNDPAGKPLIVISYDAYKEMAEYTDIFAATMASTVPISNHYLHEGGIRGGTAEFATATYLDVLGLRPSLGRWFDVTEERPGAPIVAVLGHQVWTSVFRADPSVIGRVVRIEGVPVTIVGIGPANHRGTLDIGLVTDFWLPITALHVMNPAPALRNAPTIVAPLFVKARLREGATVAQAKAAMDVVARRLEAEYPDLFRGSVDGGGEFALGKGITVLRTTDVRVHPQADVPFMALASLVLVIVSLVLAIACSNLATLLLVRGAARAKEVAVRLAMGAKRPQLVRTLLIESLLLSLAGGIAGCILAWWAMRALQRVELPFTVDLTLDYRVLAFAIALSLVTGVAFGLAPALKAARVDLLQTLRDEGLQPLDHRRLTLKNALIVFQVALSVLLLGGTSIFLQQAAAARALRVGYAVDGVAMLETDVRFGGYSAAAAGNVYDELLRRIAAVPGVQSAVLSYGLPMQSASMLIAVEGAATDTKSAGGTSMVWAGPGFFDTLRIPLLHGRVFDLRDRVGTPSVAVITDATARQYFGAVNAVGRRFRMGNEPNAWTEVIGVVRDTSPASSSADNVLGRQSYQFYRSYWQSGLVPTTVVARTSGDAAALVTAMQRELRAVDVTLPVMTAQTMAQDLENEQAPPRVVATFLGALGGLGLVLASIGLYAVVAFAVARRSREIGIRMALGARGQQVVWSIARGVAGLIGVGTGIGLVFSVLLMLTLRASSSGEANIGIGNIDVYRPTIDPVALLAIAAVTAMVGVAAAFVPARRASRMHPLVALRHE